MIQGFAYFPTIIYRDEQIELVDSISKITQKYFDETKELLKKQNINTFLYQTKNIINDNQLKFFYDYLLNSSYEILKSQGYAMEFYDLFISGLWGQEIKNKGGTDVHLHQNSQLCGWFFLEAHEGGSYPVYHDTRMNKEMIELNYYQDKEVLNATSKIHFNNVVPGTLFFSNSWIKHQLTENLSNESTKVIHFIISCREK